MTLTSQNFTTSTHFLSSQPRTLGTSIISASEIPQLAKCPHIAIAHEYDVLFHLTA